MIRARTVRLIVLSLILVCTAGCDQVTKHIARAQLANRNHFVSAGGFVEFTLADNPGAFLNLGAFLPRQTRTIFTGALACTLAVLLAFLLRTSGLRWVSFLGLALVLAGGISNLIDRFLREGLVTDFIIVRVGPFQTGIFNLADLAIVSGTVILATLMNRRVGPHNGTRT